MGRKSRGSKAGHVKVLRRIGVLLFAFSMIWLGACDDIKGCLGISDLTGSIQKAVNVLDDAIDELQNASADWQKVLTDAQSKLTEDAQSTIRNEIANVASRSVAQAGVELRCNADFIRERVRQALIRIRANILKQEVPPAEPGLCQVVPLAVERTLVPVRISAVEFYGYDFDQGSDLKVFHEYAGGKQDVTNMLDRPTHYAMTLRFGENGVQLNERSVRLALEWGGKKISTIAVIQPQTPVCKSKVVPFTPHRITFVPPHVGKGDKDFAGHGPKVTAFVKLIVRPDTLRAQVYMHAIETKKDWTVAMGYKEFDLYNPEPGWRIDRVVGPATSPCSYIDSNHDTDFFDLGSGGPAKRFAFVGDTDGDEAGTRTKMDVDFNRLQIEETEIANCVSASAVTALRAANMISPAAYQRLTPALTQELLHLRVNP